MPWRLAPQHWLPCMEEPEKVAIVECCDNFVLPARQIPELIYAAIMNTSGIGFDSQRDHTFRMLFNINRVTTPFPPPLDVIYNFDATLWQPLQQYIDDGGSLNVLDCPYVSFKGNQGGAWSDPP